MPRLIRPYFSLAAAFLVLTAGCSRQAPSMRGDKSVQANICANQLIMLADAKSLWAEQGNKTTNDTPLMKDLVPFIRCPTNCPGKGIYTLGKVGELPSCSIPEHQAVFLKKMQPAEAPAP
jgi:hypothetical protein